MRRLARDVATLVFSQSYTRLVRLVFFVLISRVLGPSELGMYAAIVAYVRIVWPLTPLGHSHLFVQHLSTRKSLPDPLFLSGFTYAGLLGLLAAALGTLGFRTLLHLPLAPGVLFLFLLGEVWTSALLDLIKGIFQGREQFFRVAGVIYGAFPTLRLLVVLVLWQLRGGGFHLAELILVLVPVQVLFVVLVLVLWVPRDLFVLRLALRQVRQGFPFSVSTMSTEIYGNVDKVMLASFAAHAVVGVYTVAYRLVQYALFPLFSLLTVTYPRFFRAGSRSLRRSLGLALRILPLGVLYAVAVVGSLWFLGGWIVRVVFGPEYLSSVGLLRVLSLTLLFQAVNLVLGDALTGAGYQPLRTTAIVATVLLNITLNLLLIPRYQGYGAAWATVLSEAGMLVLLLGIIGYLLRPSARGTG